MSRRRRAEALQLSTTLDPASSMPTASTSNPPTPEPRRSKRRKIEANVDVAAVASTSTSDVVSTGSRAQQLISKKRTRKARLAAETKVNVLASSKARNDVSVQNGPLKVTAKAITAPLTPDSVVHEMESASEVEEAVQADDDSALEDRIAALEQQLTEKDQAIEAQRTVFNTLQQQVQCQICLDTFVQPFTLVPCGHTACLGCLQQWFRTSNTATPAEELYGPLPVIRRKKTCPHCRTQVVQRPVVAHLIKSIASEVHTGWASINERSPPAEHAPVRGDPWKDIFPSERHGANRGADGAIIDHEDGGVRRCANCLTEIYHGICEGCGEEYDVEDYLSDESLEFAHPVRWLEPVPVDWFGPPAYYRNDLGEIDEDDDDDLPDEFDNEFINDGELDHDEDEEEEYESDERRLGLPLFRGSPPGRRQNGPIETINLVDDDDDEEDEEEIVPMQRLFQPLRRAQPQIIISDDEESVQEMLSDDEDEDLPPPAPRLAQAFMHPHLVQRLDPHSYGAWPPQHQHEDLSSDDEESVVGDPHYVRGVHYEEDERYLDEEDLESVPHAEMGMISDMDDQEDSYNSDEY